MAIKINDHVEFKFGQKGTVVKGTRRDWGWIKVNLDGIGSSHWYCTEDISEIKRNGKTIYKIPEKKQ